MIEVCKEQLLREGLSKYKVRLSGYRETGYENV